MLTRATRGVVLLTLVWLAGLPMPAAANAEQANQHYQSGLAYERLGRLQEAYTELQLAANLDPKNSEMALALGIVAGRLGRYDAALRELERSVALNANSEASYYELALLYEKMQRNDRALESWQRFLALSRDPSMRDMAQRHIRHLEGLTR